MSTDHRLSRLRPALVVLLAAALAAAPRRSDAAEFDVPSVPTPTLQDAVNAAALSADVDNTIRIVSSPLFVHAPIVFNNAFSNTRRLVVRPAAALPRAMIVNDDPGNPIVQFTGVGGFVTLEELDLLRNITNNHHLVVMSIYDYVLIQRCRIGSIWPSAGAPGWNNLEITYPTEVIVRNSMFFALTPGTFERGIHATSFNDPSNSLRLYDNVVADFRSYGIDVQALIAGPLVLLRNNVVSNHPSFPAAAEPIAYRSDVGAAPTVVTSHNFAFASAGHEETIPGVQSIAGVASSFASLPRPAVDPAFVERTWITVPAWDPNKNFFRLEPAGPLHALGVWGVTVGNGFPDPLDVAVQDDIEKEWRPGGMPLHTDRGADQVEPGISPVAVTPPASGAPLRAAARHNPARLAEVVAEAGRAGTLRYELFDLAGRRLHSALRPVSAGERVVLSSPRLARGVVHWRVALLTPQVSAATAAGRIVLLD